MIIDPQLFLGPKEGHLFQYSPPFNTMTDIAFLTTTIEQSN